MVILTVKIPSNNQINRVEFAPKEQTAMEKEGKPGSDRFFPESVLIHKKMFRSIYSQPSLSRPRLSRITAYLEEKI